MAIDFHYIPLNPDPISGQDVLDQTEQAINELGGQIDTTNSLAQQAIDTANSAEATANSALTEAQNAVTTANSAQTTANSAQTTANTALNAAQTAQTTANTALDNAAIAQTTADNAQTAADNAQTSADNAQTTADNAQNSANNAQTTADSAITAIDNIGTYFINTDNNYDANSLYTHYARVYVNGTAPLNFPDGFTTPIWFDAFPNEDGSAIIQTARNDISNLIYTRVGGINNSDPANPIVTWSPWNTVATPAVVKSVSVEVDPAGQPAGTYLVIVMDTESGEQTEYVDLSQVLSGAFTAGNGGIDVSSDYKISLKLDPAASQGLTVASTGLQTTTVTTSSGGIAPSFGSSPTNAILTRDPMNSGNILWTGSQIPIQVPAGFNFNTYTTGGLYYMGYVPATNYTNAPPCVATDGTLAGGMLEITATANFSGNLRVVQKYTVWQNSTAYQGIQYSRALDTATWSPWRVTSLPDFATSPTNSILRRDPNNSGLASWGGGQIAIEISAAFDFNTYKDSGLWRVYQNLATSNFQNAPPCTVGTTLSGGFLEVMTKYNVNNVRRTIQRYTIWDNTVYQGVQFTRGYEENSDGTTTWGPWLFNGSQIGGAVLARATVSSTGAMTANFGITSVTLQGLGSYQVNHPYVNSSNRVFVQVTLTNFGGVKGGMVSVSVNSPSVVNTYNELGNLTSLPFNIVIYGM